MGKKIAVITSGSIYQQMGMFNAVLNRIKHIQKISDFDYEVFLYSSYEPWLVRKLRHTIKCECPEQVEIDGIKINISWKRFSLIDYVLTTYFHKSSVVSNFLSRNEYKKYQNFDFIIAHSLIPGKIAAKVKEEFGVPFSVTWHGTDIHTHPFTNNSYFVDTKDVIEKTDVNVFVSDNLKKTSERITEKGNKTVLYNGCDERFYIYHKSKRAELKQKYGVDGKYVVTFVGNFFDVKNILKVPSIFRNIYEKEHSAVFWMLGDGKYMSEIKQMVNDLPVTLWGNQPPKIIPDFLNCTDVQILPSKNEGLPLTMVEALKCGCHAVGSLVGGIPEVIGEENCFPLDCKDFEKRIADRVLFFLNEGNEYKQEIDPKFDWNVTAKNELALILSSFDQQDK